MQSTLTDIGSDQLPILCILDISLASNPIHIHKTYNKNSLDISKYQSLLNDSIKTQISKFSTITNVEVAYNELSTHILNGIDNSCKVTNNKHHKEVSWQNKDISDAIKTKNKWRQKAQKDKSMCTTLIYLKHKRKVRKLIRKYKYESQNEFCSSFSKDNMFKRFKAIGSQKNYQIRSQTKLETSYHPMIWQQMSYVVTIRKYPTQT